MEPEGSLPCLKDLTSIMSQMNQSTTSTLIIPDQF